jgi:putative methionine-R-sulfoxide reductase with GAF domain
MPLIVPNVNEYPGHIACDSKSASEIVIPLKTSNGKIIGVMDVDSVELNSFDEVDAIWLEKIIALIKL